MPRYGFNFQWMYHYDKGKVPEPPDERALDFMVSCGLDFVRMPISYRFLCPDFDYFNPDPQMLEMLDNYFEAARSRGLHYCLNLHRAPGYCINGMNLERHNLWVDQVAQDGFVHLWETFAKRYQGIPSEELSFDLVNEPPAIGQYQFTRDRHEEVIRRTVKAIRAIDPNREIVIDGLDGGNLAMPELADLDVIQSGRGYQPMSVTHYQASWWSGHKGLKMPVYPNTDWDEKKWTRETIRDFYQPWINLEKMGVKVHIGEFGCYNRVPNDLALRWFDDLLSVFLELGWGYSLWEFKGDFGIVNHGRNGVNYSDFKGYSVDKDLLDLYLRYRVKSPS